MEIVQMAFYVIIYFRCSFPPICFFMFTCKEALWILMHESKSNFMSPSCLQNPHELARNNLLEDQRKSESKPNRVGVCVFVCVFI